MVNKTCEWEGCNNPATSRSKFCEQHQKEYRQQYKLKWNKNKRVLTQEPKSARHDKPETTMKYINYAQGVYEASYNKFEEAFTKNKKEVKPETDIQESHKPEPPKKPTPETDPMAATTERQKLMQMYKEGLLTTDELSGLLKTNHRDNMYQ